MKKVFFLLAIILLASRMLRCPASARALMRAYSRVVLPLPEPPRTSLSMLFPPLSFGMSCRYCNTKPPAKLRFSLQWGGGCGTLRKKTAQKGRLHEDPSR